MVAAMKRTSTLIGSLEPRRVISRSCRTRRSLACMARGMSPISSRKRVPPSAYSKRPCAVAAGVGEGPADVAEEFVFEGGFVEAGAVEGDEASALRRREFWWRARATSSLPVPDSPRIRTLISVGAIWEISWRTCCMAGGLADDAVDAEVAGRGPAASSRFLRAEEDFFGGASDLRADDLEVERFLDEVVGSVCAWPCTAVFTSPWAVTTMTSDSRASVCGRIPGVRSRRWGCPCGGR